jgi:hypothetical protein
VWPAAGITSNRRVSIRDSKRVAISILLSGHSPAITIVSAPPYRIAANQTTKSKGAGQKHNSHWSYAPKALEVRVFKDRIVDRDQRFKQLQALANESPNGLNQLL